MYVDLTDLAMHPYKIIDPAEPLITFFIPLVLRPGSNLMPTLPKMQLDPTVWSEVSRVCNVCIA